MRLGFKLFRAKPSGLSEAMDVARRLFCRDWYLQQAGTDLGGLEAFDHFCAQGFRSDVSPNPFFDPVFYRSQRDDLANPEVNPLVHYIMHGWKEGLRPNYLFDPVFYIQKNSDQNIDPSNAFLHYYEIGAKKLLRPHLLFSPEWCAKIYNIDAETAMLACIANGYENSHPLFDKNWYLHTYNIQLEDSQSALNHFLSVGVEKQYSAHPLFDSARYLVMQQDVASSDMNPFLHYLEYGEKEGRSPHTLVDLEWLSQQALSIGRGTLLEAYVAAGADESVSPHPDFDQKRYISLHEDRLSSGQSPLVHYIQTGWREGRNPSAIFSSQYYLEHNPDVRHAGLEPFTHYVSSGRQEGRFPRPIDRDFESVSPLDLPYEVWKTPQTNASTNLCIFNTYSFDGHVEPHVSYLVDALKRQGLCVIVIIATDGLRKNPTLGFPNADGIIVRDNHGWDFAAWATVMAAMPQVWNVNSVIFCNDSIYGPLDESNLSKIIKKIHSSLDHIVALTDSHEVLHHFQSFFWAITKRGLQEKALREWWSWIGSVKNKDTVIATYELYGIERWTAQGVSIDVIFPARTDVAPYNPTLQGWKDTVGRGFPFLKVQLLRDRVRDTSPKGWQKSIANGSPLQKLIESHVDRMGTRHQLRQIAATTTLSKKGSAVPAPGTQAFRYTSATNYYGASSAVVVSQETDRALEVPFAVSTQTKAKTAAIIHVFYVDMLPSLLEYVKRVKGIAVFISTDTDEKRLLIEEICRAEGINPTVRIFPNRGRDIAPFLLGFTDVFDDFDYIIHLHTKKSPHEARLHGWRDYLLGTLLGSTEIVESIQCILDDSSVGLVFAQHYPEVRRVLNWGFDFDLAKKLMSRLGAPLYQDQRLDFPSSSFFWVKAAALRPLIKAGLTLEEFPEEAGQVDGTLAHAIERAIPLVVEKAGFRWVKVGQADTHPAETLVPVIPGEPMAMALNRACSWLSSNRYSSPSERQLLSEVPNIRFRPSYEPRRRLNLCVPTIDSRHVFGGLTTAFKIFRQIAEECPDIDLRVIITTTPYVLDSGQTFPDFTYQRLDDPCEISRSIVTVSAPETGFLPVREGDVFLGTAWWTTLVAQAAREFQSQVFEQARPFIYLVQDDERGFYPWSTHYGLAESTYFSDPKLIPIINSEELASHFSEQGLFRDGFVLPYVGNEKILGRVEPLPKERIVLVYGRPSVARNCFAAIISGLHRWQASNPEAAKAWSFVFAGEEFGSELLSGLVNCECVGKLTETEYARYLSRCAAGLSLMISPHPSYPPLEMATAGLITLTNRYGAKDLRLRSDRFLNVRAVDPAAIADGVEALINRAEQTIGRMFGIQQVSALDTSAKPFMADEVARRVGLI